MIASGKENKQRGSVLPFFLPERGIALIPHLEEWRMEWWRGWKKKGGSDWRWGRGGGVRYVTGRRLGRRFVAIVASVTASGCSGPQCDID